MGDSIREPDPEVDWLAPLATKRPLDLEDVFSLDELLPEIEWRMRHGQLDPAQLSRASEDLGLP